MPSVDRNVASWGIEVERLEQQSGSNNLVWFVNDDFVLRVYQNIDGPRVNAEHRVLEALREQQLPFQVPNPIPTSDGDTVVDTPDGPAALYHRIAGRRAEQNLAELELIGAALGDLMTALGRLPTEFAPVDWRGPLSIVHASVPDVDDLVEELRRVAPKSKGLDRFADTWRTTDAAYLALDLPTQICHLDFAPGNALVDDGVVVGVLDFEVVGLDLRINDVVAGLVQSTDTAPERDAFLAGVRSRIELTDEEWEALPTLELLRKLATVLWRAGRWREGKSTLDDVLERLADVG